VRCTLRLSGPGRRLPNRQPRARRIETSNKGETEGGNGVTTDQPEALKLSSQGQCKARQGKAKQGRQAQEISTRLSSTASDPALSPDAAQRNTAQHSTAQSLTCAWRRETRPDETRARYSLHGHPTVRTVFLVPVAHCRHHCDTGVELRPASLLAVAPIMAESRRPPGRPAEHIQQPSFNCGKQK